MKTTVCEALADETLAASSGAMAATASCRLRWLSWTPASACRMLAASAVAGAAWVAASAAWSFAGPAPSLARWIPAP